MIRWLAAALLVVPTQALARDITVQSGEHADFSRLVVLAGDVPDWSFGRTGDGYELRIDAADWRFALGAVFTMIPRDRIDDVHDLGDGRLSVVVDCDCHADAFEIRNGVVIDIKDGPAPAQASFETPLPDLTPAPAETATETAPVLPFDITDMTTLPSTRVRTPHAWVDELAVELPVPVPQSPDVSDRLAEAQAALLEQLSRAAAQGLITPDIAEMPAPRANPPTDVAVPDSDAPAPGTPEMTDPGPDETPETPPNIRVATAVELRQADLTAPDPLTPDGAACLPDRTFAIADWGVAPDNGAALSQYRAKIVGEFDSANPQSVEALVKYYIYLTFGAEARALLAAFDTEIPDASILRMLAQIMDDGVATDQRPLIDQLECETAGAIWAVLARPSLGRGDDVKTNAVITSFNAFPLHLRRHLGPKLADRFLAVGDTDTASAIRNAIARAPGDHGAAYTLLEADLALTAGEGETGAAALTGLVANGGEIAPRALVRLLDTTLDRGADFSPSLIDTAAAMAFEQRGTEIGEELVRVQIRSLAHAGRFAEALQTQESSQDQGLLSASVAPPLRREIFDLAATQAEPEAFLTLVLAGPLALGDGPDPDSTRQRVARRLLDLGFARPARDVLAEDPTVPTPADRLLFARSFLLGDQPDLAVGYLVGLDDADAKALLAQAHDAAGAYPSAARVHSDLGDAEKAARSIWRAEDWETAAEEGPAAGRAAAALAVREVAPTDPLPPIARTRFLLEQSATTRDVLTSLLAEGALR